MKKSHNFLLLALLCSLLFIGLYFLYPSKSKQSIPKVKIEKKSFWVTVKAVGELEAARSIIIASSIKGDQGKIIDLISDGAFVKKGDTLVKMDPTPFEEKIEKLKTAIKEQETHLITAIKTLEWEENQAEHEAKSAVYDTEAAQLELEKIMYGDGPQEISRLKSAMQKALLKYEELKGYANDLHALEEEGFLNPIEIKQVQKKLEEEEEAYENAKLQYDSYVNHVHPMQIKKAEAALKRAIIKQEEVAKTNIYKIDKSFALLEQAKHLLASLNMQLKDAEQELLQSEIKAPDQGMAVHKEEFRGSQRRRPWIGDVLVKNQTILELPDLEKIILKTKVREIDLFKIEIGKKAFIKVDAYPDLSFEGKIESIGILALADLGRASDEKFFEVRIALDKSHPYLRPGMTARASILSQEIKDSLSAPIHAIFSEGSSCYCYVPFLKGYKKQEIKIGANNEEWAEIKSGLQEGQFIYLLSPVEEQVKEIK